MVDSFQIPKHVTAAVCKRWWRKKCILHKYEANLLISFQKNSAFFHTHRKIWNYNSKKSRKSNENIVKASINSSWNLLRPMRMTFKCLFLNSKSSKLHTHSDLFLCISTKVTMLWSCLLLAVELREMETVEDSKAMNSILNESDGNYFCKNYFKIKMMKCLDWI